MVKFGQHILGKFCETAILVQGKRKKISVLVNNLKNNLKAVTEHTKRAASAPEIGKKVEISAKQPYQVTGKLLLSSKPHLPCKPQKALADWRRNVLA